MQIDGIYMQNFLLVSIRFGLSLIIFVTNITVIGIQDI